MRTLGLAVLLFLLAHVLASAVFAGWLGATDRLSRQRILQVVEVFRPTLEEQREQEEQAEQLAEQARQTAEKAWRLASVADGPRTLQERLVVEHEATELARQQLERLQRETADLHRQ